MTAVVGWRAACEKEQGEAARWPSLRPIRIVGVQIGSNLAQEAAPIAVLAPGGLWPPGAEVIIGGGKGIRTPDLCLAKANPGVLCGSND